MMKWNYISNITISIWIWIIMCERQIWPYTVYKFLNFKNEIETDLNNLPSWHNEYIQNYVYTVGAWHSAEYCVEVGW